MPSENLTLNRNQVQSWAFTVVLGLFSFLGYQLNDRVDNNEQNDKQIIESMTTMKVEFDYLKLEVAKNSVKLDEPRFTTKDYEARIAAVIVSLNSNVELDKKQMALLEEISQNLMSLTFRVENLEK